MPETEIVKFLGWQEHPKGAFPLFNINLPGHPLNGSTVSLATLIANYLPIPEYPPKPEGML
jgi:hypothetical protein